MQSSELLQSTIVLRCRTVPRCLCPPRLARGVFGVARGLLILFEHCIGLHLGSALGVLARLSSVTACACLAFSAARCASLSSAVTRFEYLRSAVRSLRASAVSTRAACRSVNCASLASAVARILSKWACFALAAVCRRSAKPGSLRDMSLILPFKAFV